MTAAQAEIALLKASLTGGVSAQDTFSRQGTDAGSAYWQSMPVGSTGLLSPLWWRACRDRR